MPETDQLRAFRESLDPSDFPGQEEEMAAVKAGGPIYNAFDVLEDLRDISKNGRPRPDSD